MLAYFCFLEQLLVCLEDFRYLERKQSSNVFIVLNLKLSRLQVGKMGTGAIAISLPFSCVLGLLASMTSSTMGM